MSGWLPPGCTDKDIDDAAPQSEPEEDGVALILCEVCDKLKPANEVDEEYNLFGDQTMVCHDCKYRGDWPPLPEPDHD